MAETEAEESVSGDDEASEDEDEDEDSSDPESDDDDEDDESSSVVEIKDGDKPNDGLSHYERLRLERIARNKARLAQLGFSEDVPKKDKKKKTISKPRRPLPEGPRRQLPGRASRATFNESALASVRKEKREEEKNPDACYACQKEDGELRSCDYCRKLYHPNCHVPFISPDDEEFKCASCEAAGKSRRVACGKCNACTRSTDCMTCVACVNKYSGGLCKSKCIFRKCQSWGKAKLKPADEDNEKEDSHDVDCFVCKNGGDLICCDSCTKVYHSNCHKPKIYDLPEGFWQCMHCKKAAKLKEKHPKYTGPLTAVRGHRKTTCTVRFPKIECVVCDREEVTGALKPLHWTTCRTCDDSYHLACLDPPLEKRPSKWRCPACKEKKEVKSIKDKHENEPKESKEPKDQKPLFEGEHDDVCFMCSNGGDLLCCDFCEKAYHLECHIPPLCEIPAGIWKCQECAAVEYTRKMKCGECEACLRDDCGKCVNCLDKPKFGGKGRMKQACVKRKCPYLRFAPPAKLTPQSVSKQKKKEIKLQFAEGGISTKKRKKISMENKHKSGEKQTFMAADSQRLQGNIASPRRGCESKRHKVEELPFSTSFSKGSDERSGKKRKDSLVEVDKIFKSKPLKDDPVGNKIRRIIVKALKHPESYELQDKVFEMLRSMASTAENASKIILLGGLGMIANAMKKHSQMAFVQAQASALLTELMLVCPPCICAIIEEGCLHLVLVSLQCHFSNLKALEMGFRFFRAMSYDFANHESIASVNGVMLIIDAMKKSPKNYEVLKEGFYFLQNMICNSLTTHETIELVLSKGTVPLVADAILSAKSEVTEYLLAACGVLSNLATKESERECMGDSVSLISALLTVLLHGTNAYACKCSLDALKLIAIGNDDVKAKIVHSGGIKVIMRLLLPLTDTPLVDKGMKILAELTKGHIDNAGLLVDAGGIEFVLSVMGLHPMLSYIQASCCCVLRNIPVWNGKQAANTVSLILAAMKNHENEKIVQYHACHVLLQVKLTTDSSLPLFSELIFSTFSSVLSSKQKQGLRCSNIEQFAHYTKISSRNSAEIKTIIKSRPLKDDPVGNKIRLIVVNALKRPGDSKFQDKACKILRCMTTSAENASKIIQLGGLRMVSQAMKEHPLNSIILAEASALLAELTWVTPACVHDIIKEGCLKLVLNSMQRHSSHSKVQQMGCGFFRAISYDFANHKHIVSVNGVTAIIKAMKMNWNKYEVLKEGCYFLQNILCNAAISPETIETLISKEVIAVIFAGTKNNPADAHYIGAACGVLANMAVIANGRLEQIHESCVPILLSVLGYGVDMDSCRYLLNALKLFATGNNAKKKKILCLQGIRKVLNFLTHSDIVLVDSGLGLLAELTKCDEIYSQMLLEAGGFDWVMTEMSNHTTSSHLQARACEVLRNLPVGMDKVNLAVNLILRAMKTHTEDRMVQYQGCHALVQLCYRLPGVAEMLKSVEARSIICLSAY